MDLDEGGNRGRQTPQASQLTELLECERELAEMLEKAREEARELVESARAGAAAAAARLEASLEEEAERERQRIRAETQKEIRRIVADARARAERYEQVPEGEVRALAEAAFRRLISGEG